MTEFEQLLRPGTKPPGLQAFAVEPRSAQLVWVNLGIGEHRLELKSDRLATRTLKVDLEPGPGAYSLDDLVPGTDYTLDVRNSGESISTCRFSTPTALPGEELFRFATISDVHLGRSFAGSQIELNGAEAAISEALGWGAERLVVKGDLCDQGFDWIWDQASVLLGELPIPVSIIPGNHETGSRRKREPEQAAQERGLHLARGPEYVDVPGLRLVLVDSTVSGTSWGTLAASGEAAAEFAADARRDGLGTFIATHHYPQRLSFPVFWPQGVPGPDVRQFASAVAAASPNVLTSSGHTHRCRYRSVVGLKWSEVAATSQFPGVWAGYVVHESGIRQVVRRIEEPETFRHVEAGRGIYRGAWALWSTGNLSDRCFNLVWR